MKITNPTTGARRPKSNECTIRVHGSAEQRYTYEVAVDISYRRSMNGEMKNAYQRLSFGPEDFTKVVAVFGDAICRPRLHKGIYEGDMSEEQKALQLLKVMVDNRLEELKERARDQA